MINSIEELSDVITNVVNRIVEESTQRTSSGNYYASHDMVSDLISHEDYLLYFDFIRNELLSREEVLDLDVTDDHEFDAVYGLAYCPNYQWCEGDEKIFGCSEGVWEETFKAEPVSKPLSLTRMAEIGKAAIEYVLETRAEESLDDLTGSLGMSIEELDRLKVFEKDKDLIDTMLAYKVVDVQKRLEFEHNTFNEALDMYKRIGCSPLKHISLVIPEEVSKAYKGSYFILQQVNGKDTVSKSFEEFFEDECFRNVIDGTSVEKALATAREHVKYYKPINFIVSEDWKPNSYFDTFEEALDYYNSLPKDVYKSLACRYADKQEWVRPGGLLIKRSENRQRDVLCDVKEEFLNNPYFALAYAKTTLSFYPNDEKAWALRDSAEKALGITDREVDISKDLYVGKWRVHIVPEGGHYGFHNQLVHDKKDPLVEFVDMSQDKTKFPDGQYACRYSAGTILGTDGLSSGDFSSGLLLYADVPSWYVTAEEMSEVIKYVKSYVEGQNKRPSLDSRIADAKGKQQAPSETKLNSREGVDR